MSNSNTDIVKLTYQEAQQVLRKAYAMQMKTQSVRFGQALWNSLPNELTRKLTGTDADFYYEQSDQIAHEKFYEYFVEQLGLS